MPIIQRYLPAHKITQDPFQHFFGYYDKSPWDLSGALILALRVGHQGDEIVLYEPATIGVIGVKEAYRFEPVAQTSAWNWQQGAMVQWLDNSPSPTIIYNIRKPEGFGAILKNIETGSEIQYPLPIYVVSPDNDVALSLNFSRLNYAHPTIGYKPIREMGGHDPISAQDGIFVLNLMTGQSHLLISLEEAAQIDHRISMEGAFHWFSHLAFNPSGTRFLFLHRWSHTVEDQATWMHRLLTANRDGSDIRLLECTYHPITSVSRNVEAPGRWHFQDDVYRRQISHPTWRSDTCILAWSCHNDGTNYHLYSDHNDFVQPLGKDLLPENGHCTYDPSGDYLLTDTYPDINKSERNLILYHADTNTRIDIGRFYSPEQLSKETRCDLHPRWRRDGKAICIDSYHQGERQMYVVDVSEIVDSD